MKNIDKFIRDEETGAIINIDNNGLEAYKKQKQKLKKDNITYEEVKKLKEDMNDMKSMLSLILERIK